jgi:calmodulin
LFQKFDLDRSGTINFTEFQALFNSLGSGLGADTLKSMLSEIDEDGDGEVSYREFVKIFQKGAAGQLSGSFSTLLSAGN